MVLAGIFAVGAIEGSVDNVARALGAAKAMGVFLLVSTPLAAGKVLIANVIQLFQVTADVSFGSLADLFSQSSPMSALERKAALKIRQKFSIF